MQELYLRFGVQQFGGDLYLNAVGGAQAAAFHPADAGRGHSHRLGGAVNDIALFYIIVKGHGGKRIFLLQLLAHLLDGHLIVVVGSLIGNHHGHLCLHMGRFGVVLLHSLHGGFLNGLQLFLFRLSGGVLEHHGGKVKLLVAVNIVLLFHQAILHVLDTTMDAPVLSGGPMELTAEKNAYLQNHIEKLLASDDIRQCRPLPDSAFKNELEHNQDFVDLSCRIAGVLFDYMHAHTTIPGADLAVVDFTRDGAPWLGILKLNYKNGYTHYTETVEGAPVNSNIQQRACLPTQSGKVEEGALVDLTDYSMRQERSKKS